MIMPITTQKHLKKTILFTIEISNRELISKCLLTLHLLKKGFRVYIGTFQAIDHIQNKHMKSCVFFHKSTFEKKVMKYKNKIGAKFVFLDEESGVAISRSRLKEFVDHRYLTVTPQKYDHVFTIGQTYKKLIEDLPNTSGVEIHALGWPRVDLWRKEYKDFYQESVEKIRNEYGDFCLIITSFGFTTKKDFQEALDLSKTAYLAETRAYKYESLLNCFELLKNIASQLPQMKFILRPHHSESLKNWKRIVKDYQNVAVVAEGDVTPWVLAASKIIQFGSTVAVQAVLNDKMIIGYKIRPVSGISDSPIYEVSQNFDVIDDVISALKSNADNLAISEKMLASIGNDVSSLTGDFASEKIACQIDKMEVAPQASIVFSAFDKLMLKMKYGFIYVKSRIKAAINFNGSTFSRSIFEKVPGGINALEIENNVKGLNQITNIISTKINVRQVAKNLVEIECSD